MGNGIAMTKARATANQAPKYTEILANWAQAYGVVRIAFLLVCAIAIVEMVAIFILVTRPNPVIVVPGAATVGIFQPGEMPSSVVKDFALTFTQNLIHFTPATARSRWDAVRTKMGPELQTNFDAQKELRLKGIDTNQESQTFFPSSSEVLTIKNNKQYRAIVRGLLTIYVGSKQISSGPWHIKLDISRVPYTDDNPYGLQVTGVDQGQDLQQPVAGRR